MSISDIKKSIFTPVESSIDKYVSIYRYKDLKSRKNNLISTVLFFSSRENVIYEDNLKYFKGYINKIQITIDRMKELDDWDLRIYIDFNSFIYLNDKKNRLLIDFIKNNNEIEIFFYKFKIGLDEKYILNVGTIGTVVRFIPLLYKYSYKSVYITDADENFDTIKANTRIGETLSPSSLYHIFYYTWLGYNRKSYIPDNVKYPIPAGAFITQLSFGYTIFINFFEDYITGKLDFIIKKIIDESKESKHTRRTYHITSKNRGFPYGMDELFINYYLLQDLVQRDASALIKIYNDPCVLLKSIYYKDRKLIPTDKWRIIKNCSFNNLTVKNKKEIYDLCGIVLSNIKDNNSFKIISNSLQEFLQFNKPESNWINYLKIKLSSNKMFKIKLLDAEITGITRLKNVKYTPSEHPIIVKPLLEVKMNKKNLVTIALSEIDINTTFTHKKVFISDIFDIVKTISIYLNLTYKKEILLRIYIDLSLFKSKTSFVKDLIKFGKKYNNLELFIYNIYGLDKLYSVKFVSNLMTMYPIFNFKENKNINWVFPRPLEIVSHNIFNNIISSNNKFKNIIIDSIKNSKIKNIFFQESNKFYSLYSPDTKYINYSEYHPFFLSGISSKLSYNIFNNFINDVFTDNALSESYQVMHGIMNSDKFKKYNMYGVNNSFENIYYGVSYVLWMHILNNIAKEVTVIKIKPQTQYLFDRFIRIANNKVNNLNILEDIILHLDNIYIIQNKGEDIKEIVKSFKDNYFQYFPVSDREMFNQLINNVPEYNYLLM